MEVLYLIPARGGSKGVPKKNIKLLNGKPLIYYSIEVARYLTNDANICVSTDDLEIKRIVEKTGLHVPFLRPKNLAQDNSPSHEFISHALDYYNSIGKNFEFLVLLQPTSPLRTSKHIEEAFKLIKNNDMVLGVKKSKSNPYYNLFKETKNGFLHKQHEDIFSRRQDVPELFEINGAVYIIRVSSFIKQKNLKFNKMIKYLMSELSSTDIDTPFDWEVCEFLLQQQKI